MPPSTGMFRIDWPRSADDGDNTPDRPQPLDRAAFDAAQQDFGIRGAADQQRRRGVLGPGMMPRPRIAEIAIGEAQRAQEEHLEKPEEDDGDLAEKERRLNIWRHRRAVNVGRDKNIVQHQQRERSTVATRRMFSASGNEMKRHFVVVRLKT